MEKEESVLTTQHQEQQQEWRKTEKHTSSAREMYCIECNALGVPRNSGLLRMLPDNVVYLSSVSVMHLGRNYLGNRGLVPLLRVIANATSLHTLNLRENGIRNEGVKSICSALRRHPRLGVLELSGNPFTYLAARQLVHLCEHSGTLAFVGVDHTLMTGPLRASILHRIQEVVRRRERQKLASRSTQNTGNSRNDIMTEEATGMAVPIIAEDTNTLRRLSVGGVVDLSARFTHRSPSGIVVRNARNDEPAGLQSQSGSMECSTQRPPLAILPTHVPQDVPPWMEDEPAEEEIAEERKDKELEEEDLEVRVKKANGMIDARPWIDVEQGMEGAGSDVESLGDEGAAPIAEEEELDAPLAGLQEHGGAASSTSVPTDTPKVRVQFVADYISSHGSASTVSVDLNGESVNGIVSNFTPPATEADFLDLLFGSSSN